MKNLYLLTVCFASCFLSVAQEQPTHVNNSFIAFTIPEKDLLPENVAYDFKTQAFFVGSIRKGKIVKIDKNGQQTEFVKPQQDGLWMIIGMKADAHNRWLWVCSSGGNNLEDYTFKDDADGRPAGIFKFDLDSGKLIKKYVLADKGDVHFFNDLVIDSKGNVYITHMFKAHAIYIIESNKNELEVFTKPESLKYPNGITISADDKYLFVAHADGLAKIEIETKNYSELKNPDQLKISRRESIDGLYFYKNTLIGVQPDVKTVRQFTLNNQLNTITNSKILERNHPMMNNPTTGVLVGDQLYYIANAQFGSFDEEGNLFPMHKLYEPTVLKVSLNEQQNTNDENE
ncbi:SMP-30/gluconolactonase/LRE family protein [Hwangdonia lutea]|uniref:SMP-30/gluconolactonase/LRE family protein n=1 Tax=Hwangdonia lutea TaxID=3075823 RepID=A0AA97EMC5_9FLAO|nr:SMP-30/gluconolactonase/LRE family protein [Hwangdonia sp. SCSIO 19198]WOD44039.1 SMP-30/gluconolactonase/LRE family protein [Hwangdonia sp. SCSIO 19198]